MFRSTLQLKTQMCTFRPFLGWFNVWNTRLGSACMVHSNTTLSCSLVFSVSSFHFSLCWPMTSATQRHDLVLYSFGGFEHVDHFCQSSVMASGYGLVCTFCLILAAAIVLSSSNTLSFSIFLDIQYQGNIMIFIFLTQLLRLVSIAATFLTIPGHPSPILRDPGKTRGRRRIIQPLSPTR